MKIVNDERLKVLASQISILGQKCKEFEKIYEQKTKEVIKEIAQTILGLEVVVDNEKLGAERKESVIEKLLTFNNPLFQLAITEATGLTYVYDQGYTCCPDDNPSPYLNKMKKLGLDDLVSRVDDGYRIKEEKFVEARVALIQKCGNETQKTEMANVKTEIETTSNDLERLCAERNNLERNLRLLNAIDDAKISDDLKEYLISVINSIDGLKVIAPDIAVYHTSRSEHGTTGDVAYFDQANVYYFGQIKMQEWQWRDRYSASKDHHDLRFDEFNEIEVTKNGEQAIIQVELINKEHGNRWTTFNFDKVKKVIPAKILTDEEQAEFSAKATIEIEKIMAEKTRLWELKPQMLFASRFPNGMSISMSTLSTSMPYRQPSIKDSTFHANLGVATFVIEEQIDHRGRDPQIRHDLYVYKYGDENAKIVDEDHGYEMEGGAMLSLISLEQNAVTFSTSCGTKTIAI